MPMRRTRWIDPGTGCRTGPLTWPATRWWRRWTRSASTARSSFPPFRCTATTQLCGGGAARPPDRFALVKPVDPDDPGVADVIGDWKKTPGTVGIRIMLTKEANRAPDDPALDRTLRAAARHD